MWIDIYTSSETENFFCSAGWGTVSAAVQLSMSDWPIINSYFGLCWVSPTLLPLLLLLILSFCLTSLFFQRLLQVRPGLQLDFFGIAGARVFTGHMSFLSPNQQCQSTEGIPACLYMGKFRGLQKWEFYKSDVHFVIQPTAS